MLGTLLTLAVRASGGATTRSLEAEYRARGMTPGSRCAVQRLLDGDLPTATASHIGALVLHVGWDAVATASATLAGGTFTAVRDDAAGDVFSSLLATMASTGRVAAELQAAMADGLLTRTERDRTVAEIDEAIARLGALRAAVLR